MLALVAALLCWVAPPALGDEPFCHSKVPDAPPGGNQKFRLAVNQANVGDGAQGQGTSLSSHGAVWQPRGGEITFTITDGNGGPIPPMSIVTCFRWHGAKDDNAWMPSSLPLRIVSTGQGSITYAARVPQLPNAPLEWWNRIAAGGHEEDYVGFGMVPLADLRVVATSTAAPAAAPAADWKSLDVIQPIGVTSGLFSFLVAGLGIGLAWAVLYKFGSWRQVPGNDIVLKLISTKSGVASLSQLQIILWTFVVGASGIYVMALSGDLIDISNGTLVLLGITGAATVGSKLQSHQEDQAGNPPPRAAPPPAVPAVPGAITALGLAPGSAPTDSEVRLVWPPPVGGGPPARYSVQYRVNGQAGAAWSIASSTVTATVLTVVGLSPNTVYDFQVFAVNASGPGAPSPILTPAATAAPAVPPA
ncbi:fibronectin type III domain-containing protein, partial [Aliidongia dinghuensis]|uniref:fibronectin type III domain-containing protein n=1 Tax=Aliidongia dinghuensis TaxID=1867774 RepID=UPI001E3587DB